MHGRAGGAARGGIGRDGPFAWRWGAFAHNRASNDSGKAGGEAHRCSGASVFAHPILAWCARGAPWFGHARAGGCNDYCYRG
jgi:hypothetical protein